MSLASLRRFWPIGLLLLSMALAASAASCSGGGDTTSTTSTGTGSGGAGGTGTTTTGGFSTGTSPDTFDVEPTPLQTIDVAIGAHTPTVTYTATLGGNATNAAWKLDRGDAGSMPVGPSSSAIFTPSGAAGGLVNVSVTDAAHTAKRQILVRLSGVQNGADPTKPGEAAQIPTSIGDLKAGGGVGGVGGEGLGGAVTNATLIAALAAPTDPTSQGLKFLYPYDKTVWPRGMLAPLVMWDSALGGVDAIQMRLTTSSGSFSWTGSFGPPPILSQTGGAFIRQPIPQDVWEMATNTAGGQTVNGQADTLTLSLVVAKGATAYGPITQTWRVAPGRLTGSVYYNSYGTQLVKNWAATDAAGHPIGAAILGIRSGDTAPKLVVGQNSPLNANGIPTDDSGCRVCHVVASRGRWLLTQSEQGSPGDGRSYLYDLQAMDVQASVQQIPQDGVFTWAALTGDATFALTNTINPSSTNPGITNSSAGTAVSSFWSFGATPTAATATGLPNPLSAGYPSYSPDDKRIAFVDVQGQTQNFHGPIEAGVYDPASQTFSGIHTLVTPSGNQRIGYPVFTPDDKGVLYETQVRTSQTDSVMVTRDGARSELWWVNVDGTPTPVALNALNGKDTGGAAYLPVGPNNHGTAGAPDPRSSYDETGFDDTTLNYEPTVLPVVSGGYAWVVFTSRREYGNMLQSVPWRSWPPDYDTADLGKATVKKLWVAAIDLSAPPGSDPSFPAFYLPAQEILAGNSRGFWVLDPCKADTQSCTTGDQCCGGFCEPDGNGNLVCAPPTGCSGLQEKCGSAADCCDPTNLCINGFCAQQVPN